MPTKASAETDKRPLRVLVPKDLRDAVRREAIEQECYPADIVEEALRARYSNPRKAARASAS